MALTAVRLPLLAIPPPLLAVLSASVELTKIIVLLLKMPPPWAAPLAPAAPLMPLPLCPLRQNVRRGRPRRRRRRRRHAVVSLATAAPFECQSAATDEQAAALARPAATPGATVAAEAAVSSAGVGGSTVATAAAHASRPANGPIARDRDVTEGRLGNAHENATALAGSAVSTSAAGAA